MKEHKKTFYMDLEQNQIEEKKEDSFLKHQIKEQPFEAALNELFDNIKIDKINGIVQIAIPEPSLNLLMDILSKLQKLLSNEVEQRIER